MNIAIDFDDTLTAAPDLWRTFCQTANVDGHGLFVITCRRNTDENKATVSDWLIANDIEIPVTKILFTNLNSKLEHVAKLGLKIDVWIDDNVESILFGR